MSAEARSRTAVVAGDDDEATGDEWSIDLDAIVPLSGERPVGATPSTLRRAGPRTWGVSRRGLLRSAFVGATAVGMSALGIFPPAREALADGYQIHRRGCNGVSYRNCKDCCCSTVCGRCCGRRGFHKNWNVYTLRPNQCYAGGGNRTKDGWFWRACGCWKDDGTRGKRVSRCHDGYLIGESGAVKTICRKRIGCL